MNPTGTDFIMNDENRVVVQWGRPAKRGIAGAGPFMGMCGRRLLCSTRDLVGRAVFSLQIAEKLGVVEAQLLRPADAP